MKTLVLLILLLIPHAALAADAPPTRRSRLTIVRRLWEDRLTTAGGKPIVSEHYPTEEALVFLTAYDFTRDARFAQQAATQLDYSHARELNGLFVTSAKVTTRDYQARQIYNFYLAYRILGDGRYARWVDDCAAAMIRLIPRERHEAAGQTHTLFLAGYFSADGRPVEANGNVIDVNQNAEVGLAFSLLYHDPASRFFLDPLAKQIAYDELLASMSIQRVDSGEIPLTENIAGADTAYGSYAVFSWVWCQQLWHDETFEPHLRAAARWLAPKVNLAADSQRWYPKRIDGGVVPDWEAYYRLPLLWYSHVDARRFVADLFDRTEHPQATANDTATAPLYWAYYDLMGVPRSYFLDGEGSSR